MLKNIRSFFSNRKASVMFEFYVILMIGLIVGGAVMAFTDTSELFLGKSVNRIKKIGSSNEKSLGTFKR